MLTDCNYVRIHTVHITIIIPDPRIAQNYIVVHSSQIHLVFCL